MRVTLLYLHAMGKGGYPRDVRWLTGALANSEVQVDLVASLGSERDGLGSARVLPPDAIEESIAEADVFHVCGLLIPQQLMLARSAKRRCPTVFSPLGHLMPAQVQIRWWKKAPYLAVVRTALARWPHTAHLFSSEEKRGARVFMGSRSFFEAPLGVYPLAESPTKPDGEDYLLFLGRNDVHQKGIDLLLDGYAAAVRRDLTLRLVIAGQPHLDSNAFIANRTSSLGLRDLVEVRGPVTEAEKLTLLAGATSLIFLSRWDGPPRPIREALACGTPVIVSKGTNMGDVVDRFQAGRCVPTPSALVDALRSTQDPSTLTRWRAGVLRLRDELRWDRVAKQYLAGYEYAGGSRP